MINHIVGDSWASILEKEFQQEYLIKLAAWISYTRQSKTIYPEKDDVFRALKLCPQGQVKVIIIGQDPYPDEAADGLCFSYKNGIRPPYKKKSLDIIFEEIEADCYNGFEVNQDYQLDYLAKQGVLLLNSILTVFKGKSDSHKGLGWEKLIARILYTQIIDKSPKVVLLWGNEAKNTFYSVCQNLSYFSGDEEHRFNYLLSNHLILEARHPAADLYNADEFGNTKPDYPNTFLGCKHFSQANDFLLRNNMEPINWFPVNEPYHNKQLTDVTIF